MNAKSGLGTIAREDGTFLMVAMDQRESLRTMLAEASDRSPEEVGYLDVTTFKHDVVEILGPEASGFLIDPEFGAAVLAGSHRMVGQGSGTGLIVAADLLAARTDEIVGEATFNDTLDLAGYAGAGVAAAKLLVVWREDSLVEHRLKEAASFIEACRVAGLPSILEGVVRPTEEQRQRDDFDREATLIRCAEQLGALGPSLYKAEVPFYGRGDLDQVEFAAGEVTAALGCPWVVLSSQVERDDFAEAVKACCRGGASGLLAGRALWTNALPPADRREALAEESVPYMRELSDLVAEHARPWTDRVTTK